MNKSTLKAVETLYNIIGIDTDILTDIKEGILTENTARNGRSIIWYNNGSNDIAIYIDTLERLTDEEIEKELL